MLWMASVLQPYHARDFAFHFSSYGSFSAGGHQKYSIVISGQITGFTSSWCQLEHLLRR